MAKKWNDVPGVSGRMLKNEKKPCMDAFVASNDRGAMRCIPVLKQLNLKWRGKQRAWESVQDWSVV